jgi:hypothetical protein
MMRLSTSTFLVLLSVAILAFACGWLMGEKPQTQPAISASADGQPSPSFQNHIEIKPLESQRISLAGERPIVQHLSIDQGTTRTLTRAGEDMIIGLIEVTAEAVKINVNNQEYSLQSGNYVDTRLNQLTCRLLLLEYDWSSSSRNAEFSCECRSADPQE